MKNNDSIMDELDNRLDDFFAEDDARVSSDIKPEKKASGIETKKSKKVVKKEPRLNDNPLNNLKAIVLEMDWEITDENLSDYINEISRLMGVYSKDKVLFLFFKLHNSIGKYLISKKAAAHPDSIRFLHSVFSSLEKVINTPDITEKERNELVLDEVKNFKLLKSQILPANKNKAKKQGFSGAGGTSGRTKPTTSLKEPKLEGLSRAMREELLTFIKELVKREVASRR